MLKRRFSTEFKEEQTRSYRPRLEQFPVTKRTVFLGVERERLQHVSWSPDGRIIAFYIPGIGGVVLLDVNTSAYLFNEYGHFVVPAFTWSPNAQSVLIQLGPETKFCHSAQLSTVKKLTGPTKKGELAVAWNDLPAEQVQTPLLISFEKQFKRGPRRVIYSTTETDTAVICKLSMSKGVPDVPFTILPIKIKKPVEGYATGNTFVIATPHGQCFKYEEQSDSKITPCGVLPQNVSMCKWSYSQECCIGYVFDSAVIINYDAEYAELDRVDLPFTNWHSLFTVVWEMQASEYDEEVKLPLVTDDGQDFVRRQAQHKPRFAIKRSDNKTVVMNVVGEVVYFHEEKNDAAVAFYDGKLTLVSNQCDDSKSIQLMTVDLDREKSESN